MGDHDPRAIGAPPQPRLPARRRAFGGGPASLRQLLALPGVVEELELRSSVGLMAIHGGGLEMMTDVIAASAAQATGASYYGVVHPDEVDHHLSSVRYHAGDSAALDAFVAHVDVVIAVHGYGRDRSWTSLLFGGRNRHLATIVADELGRRLPDYEMVTALESIPVGLRGLSELNPVNRPAGAGVQLELPPRVRGLSPLSPPPGDDGLSAPTRALVEGLASAILRWQATDGQGISTLG